MDPIKQFLIYPLIPIKVLGVDISFTNASLFMILTAILCVALPYWGLRLAGRSQSLVETSYEFVADIIVQYTGKKGLVYFPFIFSVFIFILIANMIGLLPGAFTTTSHIVLTFAIAALVYSAIIVIGIWHHGVRFFKIFFPPNVPLYLAPFLIPVEIISFLFKPISLSIRLFVNMVAGHIVLKVFGVFAGLLTMYAFGVFAFIPLAVSAILIGFEFLVAFLQAYIFTVLSCIYLHDVLELH